MMFDATKAAASFKAKATAVALQACQVELQTSNASISALKLQLESSKARYASTLIERSHLGLPDIRGEGSDCVTKLNQTGIAGVAMAGECTKAAVYIKKLEKVHF